MKSSTSSDLRKYCPSGLAFLVASRANRMLEPKKTRRLNLTTDTVFSFFFLHQNQLTHAHWGTAPCFLLDVCPYGFGQIFCIDAQLSQQSRGVDQNFITAQSFYVMCVTAGGKIIQACCVFSRLKLRKEFQKDKEVVLTSLESHTWSEPPLCRPQSHMGRTVARDTPV